jgi:hypothetical protein
VQVVHQGLGVNDGFDRARHAIDSASGTSF